MQVTYASPYDVMMPQDFLKAERSLPATGAQALRATLEGLLIQECRGADVGKEILEVCKRLGC
jgi:hypothetical protein